MTPRLLREKVTLYILYGLTACGGLILAMILVTVLTKGAPALSVSFVLEESRDFGRQGGILYQTLGTLLLMTGAAFVCLPVALGSV